MKKFCQIFNGNGKYSGSIFIWNRTVGVFAPKIRNSDKLGYEYKKDMFVGDITYRKYFPFRLE